MKLISKFLTVLFVLGLNITVFAANSDNFTVLDVRTPEEYSQSHLIDSVNIDFLNVNFKDQVQKLDKNKTYKLYCRSGNRSNKALELMTNMGFKNIENLGSLQQASKTLKRSCNGNKPC